MLNVVPLTSLHCIIGGYAYFRQDTEGVIIDNFKGSGFDVFKLLVVAHLVCYLPTMFVVMRYR